MARPLRFGVVLFPGWEVLDVFGPVEAWNMLQRIELPDASMSILAETLDPVPAMPAGSAFQQTVVPTHTFSNPPELDVLLLPGGPGTRNIEGTEGVVEFIRTIYPKLHSIITVCTGSGLAARAGVLDGRRATTNKATWDLIASMGRRTHWIADARWVVDGNVWTTAGVSAGIDGATAWIAEFYGEDVAKKVCDRMEYVRETDSSSDPFHKLYGNKDVLPQE